MDNVRESLIGVEKITLLILETIEHEFKLEEDQTPENKLLFYYNKCLSFLNNSKLFKKHFNIEPALARGAIAEVMCHQIMQSWLDIEGIKGRVISGSLIRRYPKNKKVDYTTQLDVITVTEKGILVCECKSLFGKLETDGIQISSANISPIEPWNQNQGHIEALKDNLDIDLSLLDIAYTNIVYVFSIGKFVEWDEPEENDRVLLVTQGSLKRLNDIYKGIKNYRKLSDDEQIKIAEYLKSKIPSTDDLEEHVKSLMRVHK